MNKIFVFGTLKKGFPNYDEKLLGHCFVDHCITVEKYPLYVTGQWFVPAVFPEPGKGHRIKGELYEVDDSVLSQLDEIESVHKPDGYHRVLIQVERTTKVIEEVFIYMKNRSQVSVIHSEELEDYQDDRYIPKQDRPSPSNK